ncbi:MAG: hypothetical protein JAY64_12570 [Candidatus Thiodiazotropha weberae]|nr:hypothetical protein [Candidatus Thiodiazotropha lotti]MCW4211987.1 hypothetical protein [Candidatus Thiodiazotropha lotti]
MSGAKHKPILSEVLADALRHNRLDDIHLDSPFAASLMPLLKALGWHHYARELFPSHCTKVSSCACNFLTVKFLFY